MRVLFTVSSWPTHYFSMVPIGWALQAAGHEVRVLCTPSQTEPVGHAGLLPVPVLDGMDVITRLRLQYYREAVDGVWPYPWPPPHPLTGERLDDLSEFDLAGFERTIAPELAERAARSFDAAVTFARSWRPGVVLHDPASLEGALVARVTGVPSVLCLWGPVSTHEAEHMRIVPSDHSGSFSRYGLGELSLDMFDRVVDPCPPSLEVPVPSERLPVRYVPYNGPNAALTTVSDDLGGSERPRICVTWSTALTATSGPDSYLLPRIVSALEGLDCDVTVTATGRDVAALGPVPDGIRIVEHVPLRTLLPGCAAVLHHGGSGSTLTALWAGVPQVIATFASEQSVTGRRVATTGAGLHMLGHQADLETLRTSVLEVIEDDSYRHSAAKLCEEMLARPTPAQLVEVLEGLAA